MEDKEPAYNIGRIHAHCATERLNKWQEQHKYTIIYVGDYCKIAFQEDNKVEHMWVKVTQCVDQIGFIGILRNDPAIVSNIKCDDVVTFSRVDIEDYLPKD